MIQADREQLHQLARVVLIGDLGHAADRARLRAVQHVQVRAHPRREGHVLHHGVEVAERIVQQSVLVRSHRACVDGVGRDDEHLAHRKRHSLPQLVRRGQRRLPPLRLLARDRVGCAQALEAWRGNVRLGGCGQCELLIQIALQPHRLDVLDVGRGSGRRSPGRGVATPIAATPEPAHWLLAM